MRTSFFSVLILMIVSGFDAFAASSIEFWHSMAGEKGKLLSEIVEEFNTEPENRGRAQVKLQFIGGYEEGLNKLRTALIAKRGPHIVQVADIGTKVMIDSEAIVPLQEFIAKDPEFPSEQILPAIQRYYRLDGVFYSLPFATSNPILYYNADLFREKGIEKPPATYSELESIAARLTDTKVKRFGLTWPLHSWFFEQFIANAGELLLIPANGRQKADGIEANYTSPAAIGIVELWARMTKQGSFANVGRGWDPAEQNFLAGRAAMLITSTSDIFEVARQAPFRVATGFLPKADGAKNGGTVIGGNSLWIMKAKPESERMIAYRFLKFMAGSRAQKRWHTGTGYFPIRQDVIEDLKKEGFYEKNPIAWTAIEQLRASPENVATQGALTGVFPEAREHVMGAIEEVLSGSTTAETALKSAKARTDFSLRRYHRL